MGSFFLTNNKNELKISKILELYKKKKMKNSTKLTFNDYVLLYFKKINLQNQQVFKHKNDYVIGIGTFFYKKKIGPMALKEIYRDYCTSGKNVFDRIGGHFNFVLFIDKKLQIVTDKTGFFHVYFAHEKRNTYISNSFLAVAEALTKLTISQQALMEFAISGAVYGGETFFKEINHLEPGIILDIENGKKQKYFFPLYEKNSSIEDLYYKISNYFEIFKNTNLKITADLSGGYDTRLINAILNYKRVKYTSNTNTNPADSSDTEIPKKIARAENKKIVEYTWQARKNNIKKLVKNALYCLETSRGLFGAVYARAPNFFNEKSRDFHIIIGGYGGELYRDVKTIGIKTLNDLITLRYGSSPLIFYNYKKYKNNLKDKLKKQLNLSEKLTKKDIEKIYYFSRMRYWGGSRITYFNQYAYRIHPLLDYELISPLLVIPSEEKRNAKLQKILIEKFDHKLATYPSSYGYNFVYNSHPKDTAKYTFNIMLTRLYIHFSSLLPTARTLLEKSRLYNKSAHYVKEDTIKSVTGKEDLIVAKYLPFNPKYLSLGVKDRIYSMELVLDIFKNKLAK